MVLARKYKKNQKFLNQTILSFIFTIVRFYRFFTLSLSSKGWCKWMLSAIVALSSHTCLCQSNDFSQEEDKLSYKKLFCLKKYKSVKQQFNFWFFLIFSRAPFFRISNKVDSDSPGYLLSCHGCFFYRRNNFIKFQLRPLC